MPRDVIETIEGEFLGQHQIVRVKVTGERTAVDEGTWRSSRA